MLINRKITEMLNSNDTLTPCSRIKMMGVQLVQKFSILYRTQVFVTVLTRTCYTILSALD